MIPVKNWEQTTKELKKCLKVCIFCTVRDTGMGMGERNFVIALKTGSHLGTARPILPPMPWQQYRELSEDDLKALYAYLKSIPPIKNQVPAPLPPAGAPAAK